MEELRERTPEEWHRIRLADARLNLKAMQIRLMQHKCGIIEDDNYELKVAELEKRVEELEV